MWELNNISGKMSEVGGFCHVTCAILEFEEEVGYGLDLGRGRGGGRRMSEEVGKLKSKNLLTKSSVRRAMGISIHLKICPAGLGLQIYLSYKYKQNQSPEETPPVIVWSLLSISPTPIPHLLPPRPPLPADRPSPPPPPR